MRFFSRLQDLSLRQAEGAAPTDEDSQTVPLIIRIAAVIILVQVLFGIVIYRSFNEWATRGQFGDTFGAANALFSGLALAGVVGAILLQRVELRLQRQELALTREELHGQKEELANQSATLRRQTIETTFFQLISLLNEITRTMRARPGGSGSTPYDGPQAFAAAASQLISRYLNTASDSGSDQERRAYITGLFRAVCLAEDSDFGHFFRTLYHIIKFIDASELEDKRRYTAFVRAQLSGPVLTLLFFNCLSEFGYKKFKPLVERYALLEHIPRPDPIPRLEVLYDESAFGTREI